MFLFFFIRIYIKLIISISARNGWNSSFYFTFVENDDGTNERWERVRRVKVFFEEMLSPRCEITLASLGPRGFNGGDDSLNIYYIRKKCLSGWRINITHTSVLRLLLQAFVIILLIKIHRFIFFFFLMNYILWIYLNYQVQSIKWKRVKEFFQCDII